MKFETIALTVAVAIITVLVWQSAIQKAQTQGLTKALVTQQETIVDLNKEIYELRTELGINYSGD